MRVMFAIRSKLGDTLICYAAVRAYIDRHPDHEVWLATRKDYAQLLVDEPGLKLVPFASRVEMVLRLLALRVAARAFDVLAILWGFGPPIRTLARLVRARRKIYVDARFAPFVGEWPPTTDYATLMDPAWLVTRVFDPDMPMPEALHLVGLAERRRRTPDRVGAIGVVALANELRRNLDRTALEQLIAGARARHPGRPVWLFINPSDRGAAELLDAPLPPDVEVRRFRDLDAVVRDYMHLDAWYGTDTGLYHLAAAMEIPATVFFGPTQPRKIVMTAQPDVRDVRVLALGTMHCEQKDCRRPLCLYQAVATWSGGQPGAALADTPAACPLRSQPQQSLLTNQVHEGPRHQA